MKTKLIMLVIAAIVLVASTSCENEGSLEPRHDTLPQLSEVILGTTYQKALKTLLQNEFIESDEAHAPRNSWRLATYSLNPNNRYDEVRYFVRGEKETSEKVYNFDEWITIGMRNDTLYAFRSMLFPNNTSEALNEFRKWSDFANSNACANPYYWSAYLYYGLEDPRSVSFTVDSTNMYIEGNRAGYEEALKQVVEEDLKEIGDYYLRYNKPKAVEVRYMRYKGMLYITYDAEYTATPFWGPIPDSGDDPGSSTVDPTDPNQKPTMLWDSKHHWTDIKTQEYRQIR